MADLQTQYPANPSFTSVNFSMVTPTIQTETFSGKSRRVGFGTVYYAWEAKYPPLTPAEFSPILGFSAQTFGSLFSFEIILPKISFTKIQTNAATSATVRTTAAIGAIEIGLSAAPNKSILAAGDVFKFANHSKVYMCVSNCVSDASGNATLFFSGVALTNIPVGTALTLTAVPFTATFIESLQEFQVGYGGMASYTVQMREVF